MSGPLALVGGGEWSAGCSFDAELLAGSGGEEVVVLPTAAAFENPGRFLERATSWFADLGASVRGVPVLQRSDAHDLAHVETLRAARFIYLAGDSPMHLRSTLKETPAWEALVAAWEGGATVAASGGAASAVLDPMFDPRGGAFTMGLGLLAGVAVLPGAEDDVTEHHRRTFELAGAGVALATVQRSTALVRDSDGWRVSGAGQVRVFVDQDERGLGALPV